jgi:hypothetical protein
MDIKTNGPLQRYEESSASRPSPSLNDRDSPYEQSYGRLPNATEYNQRPKAGGERDLEKKLTYSVNSWPSRAEAELALSSSPRSALVDDPIEAVVARLLPSATFSVATDSRVAGV